MQATFRNIIKNIAEFQPNLARSTRVSTIWQYKVLQISFSHSETKLNNWMMLIMVVISVVTNDFYPCCSRLKTQRCQDDTAAKQNYGVRFCVEAAWRDIFQCKHTWVPHRPGRSSGSWLILASSWWCRSPCGSQCSSARSQNPLWSRKSQCLGNGSRHAALPNLAAGVPGSWFQAPGEIKKVGNN